MQSVLNRSPRIKAVQVVTLLLALALAVAAAAALAGIHVNEVLIAVLSALLIIGVGVYLGELYRQRR